MTHVYEPKIEIRLIKAAPRAELAPGVAVDGPRYGQLKGINLTPFLSETGGVRLGKSVRSPMGGFSITLADRMYVGPADNPLHESIYALIEPMDLIEIRMAHDTSDPAYVKAGKLPIAMRGFVSTVRRNETITGGQPMRTVNIIGHDFGKLLETIRIYYLYNSVVGDKILSELKFFQKYAGAGAEKIMPAAEFVELVLDNVVNPLIQRITGLADRNQDAVIIDTIEAEVSIEGVVSPYMVSAFPGGSVYEFLTSFLDAGPFNEVFLEERETTITLVVRPNPFLDPQRKPIQAGNPDLVAAATVIDAIDIEVLDLMRGDDGVSNYYWVYNAGWQIIENLSVQELSQQGSVDLYAPFNYPNCDITRYGFKKMEVESRLGPGGIAYGDAPSVAQLGVSAESLHGWLDKRRVTLAAQNKDNVIFERGSLQIRGNEKIKAGSYIVVRRGALDTLYYVVAVDHTFVIGQSFKTTLTVERGTGFIDRAQRPGSPYLGELTLKGSV